MKTTRYFEERVLPKRPYIDRAWCAEIIAAPLHREEQPDGRVRFWGEVTRPGEAKPRILRVVTLTDGETIHNAFFDRRFRKDQP
ncbi:MAG: hypothetical protein OXH92_09510 [Bryobacterales bacterium]|nr:hypothetical protein [Bryobacterales bacterium]MDE0295974.1 hypothetical protein [Bryobacterales bacterium]MDE0434231.1 hypothetical protein [Bryobacterales bacterium]